MKSTFKTCLLTIAVLGLAACETTGLGDFDDAPPYAPERTAQHTQAPTPPPAPEPAPAPVAEAPSCSCDCTSWEQRALQAEKDLAMCTEATDRVRDAYRDELKK